MKAILLSIRPQFVAKILNGEKTIEIRRQFPRDYVGWVYIYCTKEQGLARLNNDTFITEKEITKNNFKQVYSGYDGKGKVVARFWVDKVERELAGLREWTMNDERILEKSCLTFDELCEYAPHLSFYAIHITKLEIFDKPKELGEFWNNGKKVKGHNGTYQYSCLISAPQSWCYIEV